MIKKRRVDVVAHFPMDLWVHIAQIGGVKVFLEIYMLCKDFHEWSGWKEVWDDNIFIDNGKSRIRDLSYVTYIYTPSRNITKWEKGQWIIEDRPFGLVNGRLQFFYPKNWFI